MGEYKYMRYGNKDHYSEVQKLKKSLGEIPEETCPDIDLIIDMLEKLREDNATLRNLGREWYKMAEDVSIVANELQDKCDELESERDELYTENESLKSQIA